MYEWHEGLWVKHADHLAAVEKLEAENARLRAPVSDEEWMNLCAGDLADMDWICRRDLDRFIAARAAEPKEEPKP